jgi:hypothetical protein
MMAQPLRKIVRWLGGTDRDIDVEPTCPLCGSQLAGPYRAGGWARLSGAPFYIEPSREELIAKCPTHGHAPYNTSDGRH